MEEEIQFTEGQTLYSENPIGEICGCEYLRHLRGQVHIVRFTEGEYRGTSFKETDELLTEKPNSND